MLLVTSFVGFWDACRSFVFGFAIIFAHLNVRLKKGELTQFEPSRKEHKVPVYESREKPMP